MPSFHGESGYGQIQLKNKCSGHGVEKERKKTGKPWKSLLLLSTGQSEVMFTDAFSFMLILLLCVIEVVLLFI